MKKQRRDWLLYLGGLYLIALLLLAIFGPHWRFSPLDVVGAPNEPFSAKHPFGTDEIGRDSFSRIAQGARISLTVGLVVQAFSLVVGILVGSIGTFAPKWLAQPVLRFTDGMFAFPDILLAILIVSIYSKLGMIAVIAALSITAWPSIARLVKTQLATLKDREYVVAARAAGASTPYLIFRHILPQLTGLLLAVTMIELAGTILAESTLSFLGIGIQPPAASWGSMINQARTNMNSYPWQLLWPCVTLALTVFALNFVGDGLRAYLDPKNGK